MELEQYQKVSKSLLKKYPDAESGKMFGKECLKINGKAFAAFHQNKMVFKLTDKDHEKALSLKGAKLWDPSGKKKPMKEWVQVPFTHAKSWASFARAAAKYVGE